MDEGGYRPTPYGDERRHYASIPLYLILTILTAFIFNLYWNYRQMVACNELLGRKEFSFLVWLLLSLVAQATIMKVTHLPRCHQPQSP